MDVCSSRDAKGLKWEALLDWVREQTTTQAAGTTKMKFVLPRKYGSRELRNEKSAMVAQLALWVKYLARPDIVET